MQKITLFLAAVCMMVLSGCMTFGESEAPVLAEKFNTEADLRLEGFLLYSVREKQYHSGYTYATAYNFSTDSWITGTGSYSGTTYERMLDEQFTNIVKDIFETTGANIRTQAPQLILEGRIGDGHYRWSSAGMWLRDIPVFVLSVCTIGMVASEERENDVRLIVYNTAGKRLKEYHAVERYYTAGFGLPLSMVITDEVQTWYCDRMAAEFALIKCMNEFIRDYNRGLFQPPN